MYLYYVDFEEEKEKGAKSKVSLSSKQMYVDILEKGSKKKSRAPASLIEPELNILLVV